MKIAKLDITCQLKSFCSLYVYLLMLFLFLFFKNTNKIFGTNGPAANKIRETRFLDNHI